ncbi:MAG: EF-P lysine aminoacylase EpmA [Desulfuromonadales bacterium]
MGEPNWTLARKRSILMQRARILTRIRAFFAERGFLEVDTPQRIPVNAPEQHIDPVPSDGWVLQTSPELAMKRMLAAGYETIFQICHVWRDGERGRLHLPEFTLLEWYRSGTDYRALMADCVALLQALTDGHSLCRQGREISLAPPWQVLTVSDAFHRYAPRSLAEAIADRSFETILTEAVEPCLGQDKPTFLIEYPAALAALARLKPDDPTVAERFELYIDGMEIANAFSELNDPVVQRQRFVADEQERRSAGKSAAPLPEKFLQELPTMPDAAGIALGLDRLIMLLTDTPRIDDVVALAPEDL